MKSSRWSVIPVVLVLLLPTPFPGPSDDSESNHQVAAHGAENVITTESTVQSIQEPGGSGSGSGGGVSGWVVVGYQEGAARRLGLCVPQEGLLGSSADTKVASVPCPPAEVAPPVSVEGVPVVVSASDVSTLLVEGSGLVRQPPGDMVIVTKDLIVYTNPSSRTLSTTVGGTPVTVAVTLTASWSATFSVEGGPPQPVSGTVTTTEASAPFDLVRLVGVLTDDAEEAQGH